MSISSHSLAAAVLGMLLAAPAFAAETDPPAPATPAVSVSTTSKTTPTQGTASGASSPTASTTAAPAQLVPTKLVTPEKELKLRRFIPKVEDQELQAILDDPRLLLYTEAEMPKAYQFWDGAFPGVHAVNYNISANNSEPFGNGNVEFPWGAPAGVHHVSNIRTFRFLWLPQDADGKTLPIVYYRDEGNGYTWLFPVGAVVGEVLMLMGPDNVGYTFELRIRRRENGDWFADSYRPFPKAEDLAGKIKELNPEWQAKPTLAKLVDHLEKPAVLAVKTSSDSQPQQAVFRQKMGVDDLPPVGDDGLTASLLTKTPFRTCQGIYWRLSSDKSTMTCAPTTQASFHIVPQNYEAGFVEVDQSSCMRCHETTNKGVDNFDSGRDWYGRVRGSDGIFSFHPFEPSSISDNGYPRPVRVRDTLVSGGILQPFNKLLHPRQLYHALKLRRE